MNVKNIEHVQIEDLLNYQRGISIKEKEKMISCYCDFISRLKKCNIIPELPDFLVVKVNLKPERL